MRCYPVGNNTAFFQMNHNCPSGQRKNIFGKKPTKGSQIMQQILLALIALAASSIGAVVGAGGGVIIKPVVDLLGLLPVSTASFCSGCTVFAMSIMSLLRSRGNGVALRLRMTVPLAVGAVCGGLVGKALFELVRQSFSDENALGAIQAVCLTVITAAVLLYVCKKDKLRSMHVNSVPLALVIGTLLGIISSFLGIGGGTSNVAMLFFFFSMDAKEAAKNSIFIILFSQLSSILIAIGQGTVPEFSWPVLLCMIAGGVGGAEIGARISKRIDKGGVEHLLKLLLLVVVCIDFYNILKFTVLA